MGLHNIDKNSMDRTSPTPNTHDTLQDVLRPAHSTTSLNPVTDSSSASYTPTAEKGTLQVVARGVATINYTASSGNASTQITVPGVANLVEGYYIHYATNPKSVIDAGAPLPYLEFDATSGAMLLHVLLLYGAPGVSGDPPPLYAQVFIPSTSTYYASNKTIKVSYIIYSQVFS